MSMQRSQAATLSDAKKNLLEKMLKERGLEPKLSPIPLRADRSAAPLSHAQQRLWFQAELEGSSATYNMSSGVTIGGELSRDALRAALNRLALRHDILRTAIVRTDNGPIQQIHEGVIIPLAFHDLSGQNEDAATAWALSAVEADAIRPFALDEAPLLRAMLVKLGERKHILYLTMHHIVSDAWSMSLIFEDLIKGYGAELAHDDAPLSPLPLQYGDYAAWETSVERRRLMDSQLEFWKDKLRGIPQSLELPTDFPRPPRPSGRGAQELFSLSPELTSRLQALSRRAGATPFMTLMAAYVLLVWKMTRQNDFAIGTSALNRQRKELEPLVGLFVNTLVVRARIDGAMSFRQLLAQVKQSISEGYANQDVPFERIVDALGVERSADRAPLGQVRFAYVNVPASSGSPLPGLTLTPLQVDVSDMNAKCDLLLLMWPSEGCLQGSLQYSSDLFSCESARRILDRLSTVLSAVCDDSEQPLRRVQYLPPDEQSLLLRWAAPEPRLFEESKSIGAWIADWARRTPEAAAVVHAGGVLSYGELVARAQALRAQLLAQGIGRGGRVGICTARTPEFVVAMVASLLAGAAYVPFDRKQPVARINLVASQARLPLMLLDQETAALASSLSPESLVVDAGAPTASPASPIACELDGDDIAYVIYTSGSTGTPKGVEVRHRSLFNYVRGVQAAIGLDASAEYLALSTLAADLGNTAIFAALCSGAALRLLDDEASLDAERLGTHLTERGVDCLKIVPSHFEMLLRTGEPEQILPRQCLVFGGEQVGQGLVERIRAVRPGLRILNHYGPTETTVGVLTHDICADRERRLPIPLGQPLPNIAAYLLDAHLQPVGIGEQGELYLGGEGVARGYLAAPDQTAERFLPDPFGPLPGERLYKTGDLARYRSDGAIIFCGRSDHQVKIRGHRVELSEIEAALKALDTVRDCVLTTRTGQFADKELVAYVVTTGRVSQEGLRDLLRERLPEYMVPSHILFLDVLPLTSNGKVDRDALPAVADTDPDSQPARQASGDCATRAEIRAVWQDVLGAPVADDEASFFAVGGHSLLATLVVFRLRKSVAPELTVGDLFANPTISGLTRFIAESAWAAAEQSGPSRTERPAEIPLTFTQERLWFNDQLASGSAAYNVPLGMRLRGQLDTAVLRASLTAIARRHESLRTTFQAAKGRCIQKISEIPFFAFAERDLSSLPEAEREAAVTAAVRAECQLPFALASGPLLRVVLLSLGNCEHVLLLTMHHIVSDGWSNEILGQELIAHYTAGVAGREADLPPLAIQYADYAIWERRHQEQGGFDSHLDYWRKRLSGAPEVLTLPTARPRSVALSSAAGNARVSVSKSCLGRLKALCAEEGCTLFTLLQAAFKVLLSRSSGQKDIVVGTTHANRSRPEVEPLIGFFVNQLPLRTILDDSESFRNLVRREAASVAADFAHHELPFNLLVSSVVQERSLEYSPLFQALFVLQNVPRADFALPGLSLERIDFEVAEAKFDISLFMLEQEDGLLGIFTYKRELYSEASMNQLSERYATLLDSVATNPEESVAKLETISARERQEQQAAQAKVESDKLQKLRSIRRKTVAVGSLDVIESEILDREKGFPLCIRPTRDDVQLAAWARDNRSYIEQQLVKYGALLFRGFSTGHAKVDFEAFAASVSDKLIDEYGDLPRESDSGRVYKSTPYPANQAILIHNESSHMHRFPAKIFFSCQIAAEAGGETPIVDCRELYRQLDQGMVEKLARKKLMYVRNYIEGVDVSWQHFFQTKERAKVESYCAANDIACRWLADDGLRTSVVCDAVKRHPNTGELVFFNQICLHHVSCVEPSTRESLLKIYGVEGLPRHVYYGDGEPIEDEVVDELRRVVDRIAVAAPWQRSDVVMLDNMLCAHGRYPFRGERKIVVAIADLLDDREVATGQSAPAPLTALPVGQ